MAARQARCALVGGFCFPSAPTETNFVNNHHDLYSALEQNPLHTKKPVIKPVRKSVPKPVPKPVRKSAPKPVPKPVRKSAPKLVSIPKPKPVSKSAKKPVSKQTPPKPPVYYKILIWNDAWVDFNMLRNNDNIIEKIDRKNFYTTDCNSSDGHYQLYLNESHAEIDLIFNDTNLTVTVNQHSLFDMSMYIRIQNPDDSFYFYFDDNTNSNITTTTFKNLETNAKIEIYFGGDGPKSLEIKYNYKDNRCEPLCGSNRTTDNYIRSGACKDWRCPNY